ncbi:hypothetical protein E2562_004484 [Oryza meyeriana var. granulata]|uniref:Uncharacterized protein n=1 Tax=Oryza meyeriana var. granulata TaxID=110450 RepID=A0A6G1F3C7_9ORYZ|nr:hypothetical protein E2562_004484 [Oryza meyeriana var. granulata]
MVCSCAVSSPLDLYQFVQSEMRGEGHRRQWTRWRIWSPQWKTDRGERAQDYRRGGKERRNKDLQAVYDGQHCLEI